MVDSRCRNMMTVFGAAVLVIGLAACGSTDDSDDSGMPMEPTEPMDPMDSAGPTELETARSAAITAATAAADAATAAGEAADAAEAASKDNRAAIQTAATSAAAAYLARMAATDAATAATAARTASDAAAAAEDVTSAVKALILAEDARDDAADAGDMAESHRMAAETAAANEVKITGKITTVGGTSIAIDGKATKVVIDDETTLIGLVDKLTDRGMTAGIEDDPTTDDVDESRPGVAARDFDIGVVYDSGDDTARLALVTQYAGTDTVSVFARGFDTQTGSRPGVIDHEDNGAAVELPLKAAGGSYYRVGDLGHTDMIASGTKPTKLYYYLMPDGTKAYVESTGTSSAPGSPGVVVHDYTSVDVEDGVRLPASRGFEHIDYGVWAGLEDAAGDGTQELAGLGIGFVATVPGGDGITEEGDMPNNGSATYDGNYVATVRAADEDGDGAVSLKHDDAMMTVSFSEGEVRVTLHDLATLEGNIDGNTFSGTTAAIHDTNGDTESADNASGLAGDGAFTGEFRGAFYGEKAKEAGGVFDFTSEDMEDGEFRGAFGGGR